MLNYNSVFKNPIAKMATLGFAFSAMAVTIVFSQNDVEKKKEQKQAPPLIYNSSKSASPSFHKVDSEKKSKDSAKSQEQEQVHPQEEVKIKQKEKKKEKKKFSPVMPSSKAPDPSIYKNP